MFTGLVEEQGKIKKTELSSNGMEITVECSKILEDVKTGSSISINGACQTVTEFGKNYIKVQASNETLNVTTYRSLKQGDLVNLERALTLSSRLDGHIVTGHIDCTAKFINSTIDGFSKRFFFELPENFSKYAIYKGSIAVNGVSLTIASIEDNVFSVELIPSTLKEVNIANLQKGDLVNIETDIFAKYTEKIVQFKKNNKIDYEFLTENGFV